MSNDEQGLRPAQCPDCGQSDYHMCCGPNLVRFEVFYDNSEHIWYATSIKPIRCTMSARDIHGAIKALFGRIWDTIILSMRHDEADEQARREGCEPKGHRSTRSMVDLFGYMPTATERQRLYDLMREGWC